MVVHKHHYWVKGGQSAWILFGSISCLREKAVGMFEWRHSCELATYDSMFVRAEGRAIQLMDKVWLHHFHAPF